MKKFTIIFVICLYYAITSLTNNKIIEYNVFNYYANIDNINNINNFNDVIKEYNNEDIIGKISIDGTNINDYILKTDDNSFYLNHDIRKNNSEIGAIFMDFRNHFDDNQLNIYAHNSNYYDASFKELRYFLNKNFFFNNEYIFLSLNGYKTSKWQIFSVYTTNNNFEHMNINNSQNHYNFFLDNSLYNKNINLTTNDKLLVLQTCLLDSNDSLIVIVAKKINQ